uniref:Splicing factor, suppressor of white-apricot homolog n=1 Tax=Denticeps clupeoides TaxID=299321 RepID=A0AAY4AAJ4_9TELE
MYRRGGGGGGGGGRKEHHNKPAKEQSDSSKFAELLVFGYACKVFRDDERAHFHEQGKHLIPWMGDKSIMIDRYDGRGHLHDLSEYDADSWNRDYQLSEEEARIEALCDEERYMALHSDLLEEEARQEEEYKRLSEALADEGTYNAVGFRYSADYYDPSQPTEEEEASKEADAEPQESEEPFVAPPGLVIPPDVELPATTKTHAIIERTANFVCKQGAQFEIVLKAKQSSNSQFDFLRFDHYLNPYYKLILRAMKEGRYTPANEGQQAKQQDSQSEESDIDDDDGDGAYLHPSLFASKKSSRLEEIIKPLQVIDPDHPLAALVRKAQQERNGAGAMATQPEEERTQPLPAVQPDYTDPNVAAMYYGYCLLPDGTYCLAPPPPGIDAGVYYSSVPSGVMPTPSASAMPPPPGTTPPPDPVISAPAMAPTQTSHPNPVVTTQAPSSHPQVPVTTTAAPNPTIIPPPPDIQPVIDKLAEYVARNGVKFEASVRAKNDPRFDFLQSWHQYNTYYEFKKHYFMQKAGICLPEGSEGPGDSETDGSTNCSSDPPTNEGKLIKASFAPISFAIKSKDNDLLPLEKNRVRLDDSDDEQAMEEEAEGGGAGAAVATAPAAATLTSAGVPVVVRETPPPPPPEEKKPVLTLEELEAKQAKQKLEARLAAAAREKLAQASKESKEKQLQAERKRKAALFLQTLRGPEGDPRRPEELPAPPQNELLLLPTIATLPNVPMVATADHHKTSETAGSRSSNPPPFSSSSSRGFERDREPRERERDREKKKKKHKRRSRSRSRSRSKQKPSLPSAYRSYKRSRSQSRSPGRRDHRARSPNRRREERERERHSGSVSRHMGTSAGLGKSKSRSPSEKRRLKSSRSALMKGSSCSPSISPDRTEGKKHRTGPSSSPSPSDSPTSSLRRPRDRSQDKDRQVSSAIVSSVQSKITQSLTRLQVGDG